MRSEEILMRLAEIEREILAKANTPEFAKGKAYRQMLDELDAKGFKRFESVYMVYKARGK